MTMAKKAKGNNLIKLEPKVETYTHAPTLAETRVDESRAMHA